MEEAPMFDHLGLRTARLDASVRFYQAVLAPLGLELASRDDQGAGLGPPGAPALWLSRVTGTPESGVHLAFAAPDRQSVDRFHAAGLEAGGRDNGRPGPRPDYGPRYYAAFLLDPDGNNVEAVCLK
jgi:catechol 2,3-dioxygenase-like lactoylglutathione lyase family enzyme